MVTTAMAVSDSSESGGVEIRSVNPWALHLQKMGLELKCATCLSLFNRPILLPCDHIFCSSCVPRSTELRSKCPTCYKPYICRDLRLAPFMENIVSIYRSLDSSFSNIFQSASSDPARVLEQCPVPVNTMSSKVPVESAREDNSRNGMSIIASTANKRIRVCSNHCNEDVGKNLKTDMIEFPLNDKRGLTLSPKISELRDVGSVDCGRSTKELNQVVARSSPGVPLSPDDDAKGSDDRNSHQGSEHNQEKHSGKRLKEQNFDDRVKQFNHGTKDRERDLKRQKRSDASAEISNSQMQTGPVVSFCAQESIISEPLVTNKTICGFCQSSDLSEDTGEMLHFIRGNQVEGSKANNPDAIHVHATCIEWAPQVYYVGETVKNLEKEFARGSKLKCSKCGLKGAVLGCYEKSCRRTYHVLCAMKDDCRWETELYLIFCPVHVKQKFPFEKKCKSNQALQNHPLPKPKLGSPWSNLCGGLPKATKEWVLCESALASAEKLLLLEFAQTFGMAVSKFYRPDVTHVVAATDADGACTRTLKVLSAILNGKWVLNINWVKACLEANHHVGEEPYEVSIDNYGCPNGPKAGRLRALANEPKLFDGSKFYFSGDFAPDYKRDLQNLISQGGGIVLNSKEELVAYSRDAPSSTLIVYNTDPPQACKSVEEVSILWERSNEAEDLAAKIGSRVVGHMWILESVASCELQPAVT